MSAGGGLGLAGEYNLAFWGIMCLNEGLCCFFQTCKLKVRHLNCNDLLS